MEEKFRSWRTLLGWIISDPQEKQRIAKALNVSAITLMRWAVSQRRPHPERLHSLVDAVPAHRQQLIELIVQEYPDTFKQAPNGVHFVDIIPSTFYARVLNIYTTSPPILRASAICIAILQQIISQLDPRQLGMAVFIAQCVPPQSTQPIRSLRKTLGRGTRPWGSHLEQWTQFLGAESLPGYALTSGHAIVVSNQRDGEQWFPSFQTSPARSIVACPILLNDRTSGSLCIISAQPDYFSHEHLALIQDYANLLILAFEPREFYTLANLQLGVMPPYLVQVPFLSSFQERVQDMMLLALREQRVLSRLQTETLVWQELEALLLQQIAQQEPPSDPP